MVVQEGTVRRCPSQSKFIYGVAKWGERAQFKLCYLHSTTWLTETWQTAEIAPAQSARAYLSFKKPTSFWVSRGFENICFRVLDLADKDF